MNQLNNIQIFLRVAEVASFTEAANSLGLPKAAVSVAVQQLETHLGTRLLHRTTRRVQMTQDGQAFYERGRDLLADFDELSNLFKDTGDQVRGRLRVDMHNSIARDVVVPRLPEFLAQHPELEIELSCTNRRVDLVREGFDCVLRVGKLMDSSLVARKLGDYQLANCVSPAYLSQYGEPKSLDDLQHHQLIHYAPVLGAKPDGFEYLDAQGQQQFAPMSGRLTVNNADAYNGACLAGLGIIQAPRPGVRPYLESGELVEILPDFHAQPMPVSIVYANRRHLPKRVQVFMTWLAEIMKPRLGQTQNSRILFDHS